MLLSELAEWQLFSLLWLKRWMTFKGIHLVRVALLMSVSYVSIHLHEVKYSQECIQTLRNKSLLSSQD